MSLHAIAWAHEQEEQNDVKTVKKRCLIFARTGEQTFKWAQTLCQLPLQC